MVRLLSWCLGNVEYIFITIAFCVTGYGESKLERDWEANFWRKRERKEKKVDWEFMERPVDFCGVRPKHPL